MRTQYYALNDPHKKTILSVTPTFDRSCQSALPFTFHKPVDLTVHQIALNRNSMNLTVLWCVHAGDLAPRVSLWLVHLQLHLDSSWTKLLEIHKHPPRMFWNLQTEVMFELDLNDRWLEHQDGISRSRGEAYLQHVSLPENEVHKFIKHSCITLRNECFLQVRSVQLGKSVSWWWITDLVYHNFYRKFALWINNSAMK